MDKKYWVGLTLIPRVCPVKMKRLLEHFQSPTAVWQATEKELLAIPGFGPKFIQNFFRVKEKVDLDRYLEGLKKRGIHILCLEDSEFPVNLKNIYDPPPVIYYRGALKISDLNGIAIVGSRKMTPYGRRATRRLVYQLVNEGITIVSGLALGVDGEAHETALKAGGRTLAVLGSGVDNIYPRQHQDLADRIIESDSGAIISTFPPGTQPEKRNFPARNRIISGLSHGTVVIEAGKRSGALITADQALEQNREVFAVPGSIFNPLSRGTNDLIRKGAKSIRSAKDILEELQLYRFDKLKAGNNLEGAGPQSSDLTGLHKKIVKLLTCGELTIEELGEELELEISQLNTILMELELEGKITQLPGLKFTIN